MINTHCLFTFCTWIQEHRKGEGEEVGPVDLRTACSYRRQHPRRGCISLLLVVVVVVVVVVVLLVLLLLMPLGFKPMRTSAGGLVNKFVLLLSYSSSRTPPLVLPLSCLVLLHLYCCC
jgi:hypothetical protein